MPEEQNIQDSIKEETRTYHTGNQEITIYSLITTALDNSPAP